MVGTHSHPPQSLSRSPLSNDHITSCLAKGTPCGVASPPRAVCLRHTCPLYPLPTHPTHPTTPDDARRCVGTPVKERQRRGSSCGCRGRVTGVRGAVPTPCPPPHNFMPCEGDTLSPYTPSPRRPTPDDARRRVGTPVKERQRRGAGGRRWSSCGCRGRVTGVRCASGTPCPPPHNFMPCGRSGVPPEAHLTP
jgi:hypothetical protein